MTSRGSSTQRQVKEADFEYFKARCYAWQEKYGLKAWILTVAWERMTDVADCFASLTNKEAKIRLKKGKIDSTYLDGDGLDRLAFHEVGELLLYTLGDMAETGKKFNEEEVTRERHRILNTFENMVFWNGRKNVSNV